eukprot:2303427-Alexandrium_andersonii.AAC.1
MLEFPARSSLGRHESAGVRSRSARSHDSDTSCSSTVPWASQQSPTFPPCVASCDAGMPVKLCVDEMPPLSLSSPIMPSCGAMCADSAQSCSHAMQLHLGASSAAAALGVGAAG